MSRLCSLPLAAVCIAAASAQPAGATIDAPLLVVETATIEAGRTVIAGKTAVAGATVSIAGTNHALKSDSRRTFRFSLPWLPPTCIATLVIGAQTHPAVVSNCAPSRAGKAGQIIGDIAAVKATNWTFAVAGAPTLFAVGDVIAVSASFTAAALASQVVYPNTPKPTNQAYDVAACLKRPNGTLLVVDATSTVADVDTPLAVASVNQQIVVDTQGNQQVGLCFRAGGGNGVGAYDVNGYWMTLN